MNDARGAGVVMMFVGGAGHQPTGLALLEALASPMGFEEGSGGLALLEALASPVGFEEGSGGLALARVRPDWTGYRMWTCYLGGASGGTAYRSAERESSRDLCADDRYVHTGSEETVDTAFAIGDVGWTTAVHQGDGVNTSHWPGRGTRAFDQVGEAFVLVVLGGGGSYSGGSTSNAKRKWKPLGWSFQFNRDCRNRNGASSTSE